MIIFVLNCIHVLEMATAFQLVLEADEDDDLPVFYMQKLISLTYLFREGR